MKNTIWIAAVFLAVAGQGLPATAQATTVESDAIDSARSTLAKWVETKQIISQERKDWELGREVLEQRIALLEGEISSIQTKTAETRGGLGEATGKQRELVSNNRDLRNAANSLLQVIGTLERKTQAMLVSLPEPLAQRVEPLSRKLPKDPTRTELSLSARFQNVLGILNEVNKFNREVAVTREIRDLPDGSTSEVEVLYLGLAQAFYVTPNGSAAGTGTPGPEGWSWKSANDLADEVAQAIDILQNDDVPAYVPLPIQVR